MSRNFFVFYRLKLRKFLAENARRDTTFTNDLAMLFYNLGLDVFKVLRAANSGYP